MLGYETAVVNGIMVNTAPAAAYDPLIFGPAYTGGTWLRQGVYSAPAVVPSPGSTAGSSDATNFSGAPASPDIASGSKFSFVRSPVLWVLLLLGISLFMLHTVIYKN